MTRRQPSNYDLVADLEANIANAAWVQQHIDDWTGPSSSTGTGSRQGGTHSDPTLAAVEAEVDHHGTPTTRLVATAQAQLDDLALLRTIAARMNSRRHQLEPMRLDDAKIRVNERTTPSTIGFCEADDESCDAHDEYHSLIGGLCGACRKAFQRSPKSGDPGGDRRAFIETRRREVGQRRRAG